MPLCHVKTRSIGAGREMCESSKARRPDTEWVPGALLPGLSGRTTESAALHPYPIGGTVSLYGLFSSAWSSSARILRADQGRAASYTIRRLSYDSAAPKGIARSTRLQQLPRKSTCERYGNAISSYHKRAPLPSSSYHGRRTAPQLDHYNYIISRY